MGELDSERIESHGPVVGFWGAVGMLCSGGKVSVGYGPGHSGAHSYWNSEDCELQDVLDARAPLPSVFCVRSEKRGAVSLRVELDTPVEGNLELLSAEAEGQSVIRIETRQQIYSVRGFHAGENPACMSLKLTQGWSLARVSWAFY